MKVRTILWILVLTLLLSACGGMDPTNQTEEPSSTSCPTADTETTLTSLPTETSAPTEPTLPPPREDGERLSGQQLQGYQQLFSSQGDRYTRHPTNPYNVALTIEFTSPEQIDLAQFFENGFIDLRYLTEQERVWLEEQGYSRSRELNPLPVSRMNEILTQHFGLTIEETEMIGLDTLPYNAEMDRYYRDPGGVRCMIDFQITDGYFYEGGLVRLYYIDSHGLEYMFTMQSNMDRDNGAYGYRFLSNLPTGN